MLLDLQRFIIKEQVAFMKTTDTYDIFDADTQKQVAVARENPGSLVAILRLLINKKLMPTKVEITSHPDGKLLFSLKKPVGIFREKVEVRDAEGQLIGYFKSKMFSFGGGFWVYDKDDRQIAQIKGKWHGWDFKFLGDNDEELGQVNKKWAGLGKELFTSADTYIVSITDEVKDLPEVKMLLLGAALAIDVVYYEN